eukprot:5386409-Amphidinium_carterae.2
MLVFPVCQCLCLHLVLSRLVNEWGGMYAQSHIKASCLAFSQPRVPGIQQSKDELCEASLRTRQIAH